MQASNNDNAVQQPSLLRDISKMLIGYLIVLIMILIVFGFIGYGILYAISKTGNLVRKKLCKVVGPIVEAVGSDACSDGPGNITTPEDSNANYIFQTINENGNIITYDVPGDGSLWYLPAYHFIKSQGVKVLDCSGGTINLDNNPKYHGILFENDSLSIFANSVNDNAYNAFGDRGRRVYGLPAPENYVKESKFLYRDQVGQYLVYAVFKRKTFIPPTPPDFIFGTYNSNGGIGFYAIPENEMWTTPAYLGIKTDDVQTLEYKESYNSLVATGIEFKNNANSIFKYSENDNQYNSFNTGGLNNGQSVYNMKAPDSYVKDILFLFREKEGGDYIYSVFKRIGVETPPLNLYRRSISNVYDSPNFNNYVYGTINNLGIPKYYNIPGDGAYWYKPAVFGIKSEGVIDVMRVQGIAGRNDTFPGVMFENNANTIFQIYNDNDDDNAFGLSGANSAPAVANMPAPPGFVKEPKYLIRDKGAFHANYVYAVFRRSTFAPPNTLSITNPNKPNETIVAPELGPLTCSRKCTGTGECNNPKYILRTYSSETGKINTYPIYDIRFWETPGDDIIEDRVWNVDGKQGIRFQRNSDAVNNYIFYCSTNNDSDNSYSEIDRQKVYTMPAPAGYTLEPKYAYRKQFGRDYVYAVFKRND